MHASNNRHLLSAASEGFLCKMTVHAVTSYLAEATTVMVLAKVKNCMISVMI